MKPFCTTTLALMIALALLSPAQAWAHAFLDHSEPRVGSDVGKTPAEIRIWFTQQLEPAFSTIKVFGPDGKQIDNKDTHVPPDDKKELIVSLPSIAPGTYRVSWRVLSIDTHRTQGDFKFRVKP